MHRTPVYKFTFLSICILFLQACVGLDHTPMTAESHEKIRTVELYNLVIQDEVRPFYDESQISVATGGGLLFAMIDASINEGRSKTSFEVLIPFYSATEQVDFREILATEYNQIIGARYRLKGSLPVARTELLDRDRLQQRIDGLAVGEVFAFLSSDYLLLNQARTLQVKTRVAAYLGGEPKLADDKLPRPQYQNTFVYNSDLVGLGDVASLDAWSASNGIRYAREIKRSARALAQMLVYDAQPDHNEDCQPTASATGFYLQGKKTAAGRLLRHENGRALIRDSQSSGLYSMPTSSLKPEDQRKTSLVCAQP